LSTADRTVEGGHLRPDFRSAWQMPKGHGRREVRLPYRRAVTSREDATRPAGRQARHVLASLSNPVIGRLGWPA
jgi:hypothetical protein